MLAGLLTAGCARTPVPPADTLPGIPVLQPVPNPDLDVRTSGTLGPRPARSAAALGFGEYDEPLQSSLYLCSAAGPAAGPCLAVLGGLFAVAGATSSFVYGAVQGEHGRTATALTRAQFAELPAVAALPTRIANEAARRRGPADTPLRVDAAGCTGVGDVPTRFVYALEMRALTLAFAPGYRVRLTAVVAITRRGCDGTGSASTRRLAHLGRAWTLPRETAAAGAALEAALAAAVNDLGQQTALYFGAQFPGQP